MRMHPYPMVVAIVLLLAACRPAATEWTESEAPNRLRLDDATVSVNVRFAAGSAYLLPADAQRLRAMAATGAISASDRVSVAVGGGPGLAQARGDTISAALLPYGIVTSPLPLVGVPANHAVVQVGRYIVTLPPCPNWSKSPGTDFTNSFASNFACANQTNLGQMVASPADLVSGQPLGPTAGAPAVTAVQRYMTDKVKPPVAAASGGGGGGGGGGSPGSASDNTGSQ
jgi:pilus assembly protein CpaD